MPTHRSQRQREGIQCRWPGNLVPLPGPGNHSDTRTGHHPHSRGLCRSGSPGQPSLWSPNKQVGTRSGTWVWAGALTGTWTGPFQPQGSALWMLDTWPDWWDCQREQWDVHLPRERVKESKKLELPTYQLHNLLQLPPDQVQVGRYDRSQNTTIWWIYMVIP